MLSEIQVKFASENCCKITQYSANGKIKKLFYLQGFAITWQFMQYS